MALSAAPALGAPQRNPHGRFLGVVRHAGVQGQAGPSTLAPASPNLTYHGGPVMHSSHVHVLFWTPSNLSLSFTASYKATIDQYFTDVAADSHAHSNVYATDPQYGDSTGWARYDVTFAGSLDVTDPYPGNGCKNGGNGRPCLNDLQLQNEIDQVISAHALPRGLGDIYLLYSPSGLDNCESSTSTAICSWNYYCAYHSSFGPAGGGNAGEVLYANQPYPGVGCSSGSSPNGDPAADSVISVTSHEHQETMTDPLGDAWFDSTGEENADKCNFVFGSATGGSGASRYNQTINGDHYWLQENWSNVGSACVQTFTTNLPPVVSIAVAPSSPVVNSPTAFDASTPGDPEDAMASWSWDFGDGGTGSGPQPSHTYTSPGTYTASVTATDAQGASDHETVQLTVAASNQPPTCTPVSTVVPAAAATPVPLACTDPDPGDAATLTRTIVSGPAHGTLGTIDDVAQTVGYTPDPGYTGSDQFTFRATDVHGAASADTVVSLDVENPPTCSSTTASAAENGSVVVSLPCAAGGAGDAIVRSIVSGPAHGHLGTIDQGAGTVLYTPDPGYAGSDQFSFRATDSNTLSSTARTAAITVQAPVGASTAPSPAAPAAGAAAPVVTVAPAVIIPAAARPRVSSLRLSRNSVRRGSRLLVTWRLSGAATTSFRIERCSGKSCARRALSGRVISRRGSSGANSFMLSLRGIRPGRYVLVASTPGAAAKTTSFTVLR